MLPSWIELTLLGASDGQISLNWTDIVIAVSTGWAALIITLTALFAVLQIRHLRQTRSADTFQRLYMTVMERATDFLEFPRSLDFSDYSDYKRKYMVAEPDKLTVAGMDVTTGPSQEHALSPRLCGKRIGGDRPDRTLHDLHVNPG